MRIITVCTGNICRSPAAEALLLRRLSGHAEVESCGTHAVIGAGTSGPMLALLNAGASPADTVRHRDHRARQATAEMLAGADIVIAMTRTHLRECVEIAPSITRRVFLLDELAAAARTGAPLPGLNVADRLSHIPDAIAAFRPSLAQLNVKGVPDPYGLSDDAYAESFRLINDAVTGIAAWVTGTADVPT